MRGGCEIMENIHQESSCERYCLKEGYPTYEWSTWAGDYHCYCKNIHEAVELWKP